MPASPRRTSAGVLAAGVLAVVVALVHPSDRFDPVRRLAGLGPERPLPAPAVLVRGGAFAFVETQPGSSDPVGWDPCEPIRYAVNPAGRPDGGAALVERAFARTSAATGLVFEDVGETTRRPFAGDLMGPGLFGLGSDPHVVVGWGDAAEFPELAGDVAGLGGAAARQDSGRLEYATGGIALDAEAFTPMAVAQAPRVMEAIVVHEVAHVVGLAHVAEPMEMMFDSSRGQVEYGPGDREGLARLGSIPCT